MYVTAVGQLAETGSQGARPMQGGEEITTVTLEIPYDLLSLLLLNIVYYKRLQSAITRISGVEFSVRQVSTTHSLSILVKWKRSSHRTGGRPRCTFTKGKRRDPRTGLPSV